MLFDLLAHTKRSNQSWCKSCPLLWSYLITRPDKLFSLWNRRQKLFQRARGMSLSGAQTKAKGKESGSSCSLCFYCRKPEWKNRDSAQGKEDVDPVDLQPYRKIRTIKWTGQALIYQLKEIACLKWVLKLNLPENLVRFGMSEFAANALGPWMIRNNILISLK